MRVRPTQDRVDNAAPASANRSRIARIQSKIQHSVLIRDTANLGISQVLRVLIQAAYFVLLARSLGAEAYGSFIAIVATAAILSPFSGLGTGPLFVRDVRSARHDAALCWGNGILITIVSGSLLAGLAVLFGLISGMHTGIWAIAAIYLADLVFMRITELAAFGFGASWRMREAAIQNVVISLLRLIAIALLVAVTHRVTLTSWAVAYALATVLGTIYALIRATRLWGPPRLHFAHLRGNLLEGLYFSISVAATTIYNDIDKVMLARLSDLTSTGIYGAAYRLIDVSMTPVRSLISAAYPQFFEKGAKGIRATFGYAKHLIRRSMVYGVAVAVSLWVIAPVLPHLLGSSYRSAVPALRMLAVIPFLRCIHAFLGDSLSGSGHQAVRMLVQVGIAALNIALNLVVLPRWSWRGAAWTSVACDGALVIVLWLTVCWYCTRESRALVEENAVAVLT
jgi:O-antigen/teichoic acid export membrane protein